MTFLICSPWPQLAEHCKITVVYQITYYYSSFRGNRQLKLVIKINREQTTCFKVLSRCASYRKFANNIKLHTTTVVNNRLFHPRRVRAYLLWTIRLLTNPSNTVVCCIVPAFWVCVHGTYDAIPVTKTTVHYILDV